MPSRTPDERTPILPRTADDQVADEATAPTLVSSLRATAAANPILNWMLVFVPLGILAGQLEWGAVATFWINFAAIIPLAKLLSFATEELALRTNQTIGGLLNATFGNLVEMLVSVMALSQGLVRVVQTSLLGSVLSNVLLVLGFCFLCGGLKFKTQTFNETAANTSASLLAIAVMSLLVPAAFVGGVKEDPEAMAHSVLSLSRVTAIIMLIVYCMYLYFQLSTHAHLYEEQEEETEVSQVTGPFAIGLLILATVTVAVNSEYLVGSIEGLTKQWGLSEQFVGLVLLPIVGNAAEHVGAITFALKNKMDLSLGIAVGSSMQIALLVTPLMVVIGWVMGQPMTLFFELFDVVALFVSILIVNYIINDGRSNWLEGCMLLATYSIIASSYYMMP